jgi:geranylgeranyl diphosphate synthase, type II
VDFQLRLTAVQEAVEQTLREVLPGEGTCPTRVHQAMRYSVFGRAKRVRPALCLWSCEAAGGKPERALGMAAALEMIHVYSLIHDDLPAMDDDDMRRGRRSCHRQFDEATAILAGDALLTEAFLLITTTYGDDPRLATDLVKLLGQASGSRGMVGGQVLDMEATGGLEGKSTEEKLAFLEQVHGMKTGALLLVSVMAGARIAGACGTVSAALERYGRALGLAFQVTDDILDCTQSSLELGKTSGKDAEQGKLTYPALLGLAGAHEKANTLFSDAIGSLDTPGISADALRDLGRFIVERSM